MYRRFIRLALLLAALLGTAIAPPGIADDSAVWRERIRPGHRERIQRLRDAWREGLEPVPAIDAVFYGQLLNPNAALPDPRPQPGLYRCRNVKLNGVKDLVSYQWFTCRVDLNPDGHPVMTKISGSQRPAVTLYPDDDSRMVFLGGIGLGDDTGYSEYGDDPDRDQYGVFQRIGPGRYRLVQPFPPSVHTLVVWELEKT